MLLCAICTSGCGLHGPHQGQAFCSSRHAKQGRLTLGLISDPLPAGLMVTAAAKAFAASSIAVADIRPDNLPVAQQLGAKHVLDLSANKSPEAAVDAVRDVFGSAGPDIIIDCAGFESTISVSGGDALLPAETCRLRVGAWVHHATAYVSLPNTLQSEGRIIWLTAQAEDDINLDFWCVHWHMKGVGGIRDCLIRTPVCASMLTMSSLEKLDAVVNCLVFASIISLSLDGCKMRWMALGWAKLGLGQGHTMHLHVWKCNQQCAGLPRTIAHQTSYIVSLLGRGVCQAWLSDICCRLRPLTAYV